MNTITKRQKEVLDFISDFFKNKGFSPSFEEIGEHFGLSALSTVHEHITALVDKGYLKKDEHRERGLYLPVKRKQYLEIPLIGAIACGQPIEALEHIGEIIKVIREPILKGNLYALRAKGDSMIGDGIFDGDIIIARKQNTAENSDTVVATINNEATLKKFYQEKDYIKLQPANLACKPIYSQSVEIRGVVVKIIRNLA
ncbi:transcriptional repressor LexA [Candidatus Falkowbacteria bacterium]|nr:transcriptional repressor LexA [Candidatus Falkowbacteria bacterium]